MPNKFISDSLTSPPNQTSQNSPILPSPGGVPVARSTSRFRRKFRLRTVLVVPFVIPIIVSTGLVGWFSFRNGQRSVNDLVTQLQSETSSRVQQYLDSYLTTPNQINQINLDAWQMGLLNLQDFQNTGKYFWKQMQVFNVGYINFGNTKGEFIGVERLDNGQFITDEVSQRSKLGKMRTYATNNQGDRTKLTKVTDYDPRSEAWYNEPIKAGKPVWSPVYQWEGYPEVLSVSSSYPVRDRSNQIIGVIGVDLILTQVSSFLGQLKIGQSGKVFILERNGFLVANSGNSKPFQIVEGKASRLKGSESHDPAIQATSQYLTRQFGNLNRIKDSQQFSFDIGNQHQLVKVTPWNDQLGLDWLIVVVVPEADFMGQINANARTTILLCLITFAVATAIGVLTARWISGQIFKLNQSAQAIAGGDLNQNVAVGGTIGIIEIENLAGSFNSMAGQIKDSFETLEKKEKWFRTLVANIPGAIYRSLYDADWTIEFISDSIADISGYPAAELVHNQVRTFASIICPADRDIINDKVNQAITARQPYMLEYRMLHRDGSIRWVAERGRATLNQNGKPLYLDGAIIDITDRKQAEAALQESKQQLNQQNAALIELTRNKALSQGDWQTAMQEITAAAARTLEIERASTWLYGKEKASIKCVDLFELAANRHSQGIELRAADYLTYFRALEADQVIAAHDGYTDLRTAEFGESYLEPFGITAMLDAPIRLGGETIGVLCLEQVGTPRPWTVEEQGFVRSVADLATLAIEAHQRKHAEDALRISEENYRGIFENALEGIFQSTLEGRYIGVNPAMARIYGYDSSEEMVESITDIDQQIYVDPEAYVEFKRRLEQDDRITGFEYRTYQSDGDIIWETRVPVRSGTIAVNCSTTKALFRTSPTASGEKKN